MPTPATVAVELDERPGIGRARPDRCAPRSHLAPMMRTTPTIEMWSFR
jgi:hypothetical protein